jgi:hypothetical protein
MENARLTHGTRPGSTVSTRVGSAAGRRGPSGRRLAFLLALAALAAGSVGPIPSGASARAAELEPETLARAGTSPKELDAGQVRSFELAIEGSFVKTRPSDRFPLGYRREGSFTASTPFCSGGESVDLEYRRSGNWIMELRRFTCSDGSGSVTARMGTWGWGDDDVPAWSEGFWQIVEGAGRYRELRGVGTWVSSPEDGATEGDGAIKRNQRRSNDLQFWQGQVAFDDEAPTVAVSKARAPRVRGAPLEYLVQVELSIHDNVPTTPVSYFVTARGRYVLAGKSDTTSSGKASIALRVRLDKPSRRIRLRIEVWDPVGNEVAVALRLRLPG